MPFQKQIPTLPKTISKITERVTKIDGNLLAVTYVRDNSTIRLNEALNFLDIDISSVRNVIRFYKRKCKRKYIIGDRSASITDIRCQWKAANKKIGLAENELETILSVDPGNLNEHVEIILDTVSNLLPYRRGPWFNFHIRPTADTISWSMEVKAHRTIVTNTRWYQSAHVEITTEGNVLKIFATPLSKVDLDSQGLHVRAGDVAVFMGNYILLAEFVGGQHGRDLRAKNSMRIDKVLEAPPGIPNTLLNGGVGDASNGVPSTNVMYEMVFL
jgi:hypothetical protein